MLPFIIIGTPCFGGLVTHQYTMSLMGVVGAISGAILLGHESLITRARSEIVATFMDNPKATHLLFVDADISFEPGAVVRMLDFDKEFVAGTYPIKFFNWDAPRKGETAYDSGLTYVGEPISDSVQDGFALANYAGTGFQLIKRCVFERMFDAYPELKYLHVNTFGRTEASDNRFALFDCLIDERGYYLSEDFSFCKRWRAIGGEIWLDLRSRLTHHSGSNAYRGNPESRYGKLLQPGLAKAS